MLSYIPKSNSYALAIVVDHVLKHKLGPFKASSARRLLTETGIVLTLINGYSLSIQTHPDIAEHAFAETALIKDNQICYEDEVLGYYDVLRHDTPEDLFAHIDESIAKLKQANIDAVAPTL
jgi:hypothetical protein